MVLCRSVKEKQCTRAGLSIGICHKPRLQTDEDKKTSPGVEWRKTHLIRYDGDQIAMMIVCEDLSFHGCCW